MTCTKVIRRIAICFLIVVALTALLPVRYEHQFRDSPNAGPSRQFLLGTDDVGRDILSRLIHGARLSLIIGALVVTLSLAVGTFLGL